MIRFSQLVISFAFLFFLSTASLHAQKEEISAPGKISGKIVDSLTAEPIEYAAVSLQKQEDGKVVNGITTDNKGEFVLANIEAGTYKLLVDFIGYKKRILENIVVSKTAPEVSLGNIRLANKQKTLKEVTITSEKAILENKIDKMVYNVDKDVTSQGGVASDILKKIPQVDVDVDGNVELQGNSNIKFLINGKPSVMFGSNIADVLKSIPSSQIQSIEVITSPGAKYDAEGTGGIINIILKKSSAQGVNGNISLSGGTRLQNSSFNLNARKGNFGMNVFFGGGALLNSAVKNNMNRSSHDTSGSSHLLQNTLTDFTRAGFRSGIGFDWDINSKNNISGSAGYNFFNVNSVGGGSRLSVLQNNYGDTLLNMLDSVLTTSKFREHAVEGEISYKKKFKKEEQVLEVLCTTSQGNIFSYYEQTQKHISPYDIYNSSYGNSPAKENETNISINYTHPFAEDFILETGGKTTLYRANGSNDVYLLDIASDNYNHSSSQSSSVIYNRKVYAGYLSGTFKLFKLLDVKAGSRYEYTEAAADFSNSGKFTFAPYNTLVPSIIFSHTFKKEQTLKLGYTRRIERPDGGDMNPFINASDPKNISTGNIHLVPEIGDKVELSYSQAVAKKGNITTTLFFRGNTNDIQSYTRYYPVYKIGDSTYTNVAVRTRENIGHENNYGVNIYVSVPAGEKFNFRTNIAGFQRYIFTGISSVADVHGFNYRANMNITYQFSGTFVLEAFGNFNSPRINAQGTMPSFTTYNFAIRKQLFHKNGSVALTATNFFNKYVEQKTNLTGDNFTMVNLRELPYRSFGINFTLKFGKLEFRGGKEEDDNGGGAPPSTGNEK
ncbi:MAG TPA: outer membrane beta-barrel protein [Bacteroidia bacterium]